MTGGEGGIANVHVVKITKGLPHVHQGYDETYYFLLGSGTIQLGEVIHEVRPGTVVVIPAGVSHSLEAAEGQELEFITYGTLPIAMEDERAKRRRGRGD